MCDRRGRDGGRGHHVASTQLVIFFTTALSRRRRLARLARHWVGVGRSSTILQIIAIVLPVTCTRVFFFFFKISIQPTINYPYARTHKQTDFYETEFVHDDAMTA